MNYTFRKHSAGHTPMNAAARRLAPWLAATLLALATANTQAQDIPAWFDGAASADANAAAARDGDVAATVATATLIQTGGQAPESVVAVVKAYDQCSAMYEAVEEGVRRAPEQSREIVEQVLALDSCPCTSDEVWARSRLQHRLRLEVRSAPVETPSVCLCTAAVAEAAARALPGRGQQIFDAVLADPLRCNCATAAFAAIANGLGPESGPWIEEQQQLLRAEKDTGGRVVDMVADALTADDVPAAQWLDRSTVATGSDAALCRGPVVSVADAEVSAPVRCDDYSKPHVAISRYRGESDQRRALELSNRTDVPVDLAASKLSLDLYVTGNDRAKQRVQLAGIIPAQGTFVVATPEMPAGFLAEADQEADELETPDIDAIVLRQDDSERYCRDELGGIALQYPESPIPIAAPPGPEIVGEPRTDESNIDPNRGGDIASPN